MKSLTLGLLTVLSAPLLTPAVATADQHEAALIDMEKALWEGWKEGDTAPFEKHMAPDGMIVLGDGSTSDKAQALEMIGSGACEVTTYELSDFKVRSLGANVAFLVYKASQDAVCEGEKIPPRLVVSSIWVQKDGRWWNLYYQETAVHEHE